MAQGTANQGEADDLTTDGLWAMPLHTGWVALKARRLQDFENLK